MSEETKNAETEATATEPDKNGKSKKGGGKAATKKNDKPEITAYDRDCPDGGEAKTVPLKNLTFDSAYQMRAESYDEATATKYAELMADGVVFPPLYVADTGVKLIVFSGFNRGKGYELAKIKDVPVIVWKMTERDAKYWAIRQNATHGKTRNARDIRRAINAVLDDADMLAEVCKSGGQRAVAAMAGVSTGALWRALEERKQGLKNGKLVEAAPKKEKEADKPQDLAPGEPDTSGAGIPPEGAAKPVDDTAEKIAKLKIPLLLKTAASMCGNTIRMLESALSRPELTEFALTELQGAGVQTGSDEFHPVTFPGLEAIMYGLNRVGEEYEKRVSQAEADAKAKAEQEAKDRAEAKAKAKEEKAKKDKADNPEQSALAGTV